MRLSIGKGDPVFISPIILHGDIKKDHTVTPAILSFGPYVDYLSLFRSNSEVKQVVAVWESPLMKGYPISRLHYFVISCRLEKI